MHKYFSWPYIVISKYWISIYQISVFSVSINRTPDNFCHLYTQVNDSKFQPKSVQKIYANPPLSAKITPLLNWPAVQVFGRFNFIISDPIYILLVRYFDGNHIYLTCDYVFRDFLFIVKVLRRRSVKGMVVGCVLTFLIFCISRTFTNRIFTRLITPRFTKFG